MPEHLNLLDGSLYAGDPSPVYRRLRDEAPVYRDETNRLWGISRYHDVVEIETHPDRFSSAQGSRPRIVGDPSMINNDDPLHQSKRRLVSRRFTPRSVKQHEDHVRGVVTELIDAFAICREDPAIGVVVLTGAGRCTCSRPRCWRSSPSRRLSRPRLPPRCRAACSGATGTTAPPTATTRQSG